MNINNKIKSFSIFIAATSVICSAFFSNLSAMEDNSNRYVDIVNELEIKNELDDKYKEIKQLITPEEKYNFYKNYCDGVQSLTTEIENKKKQLLENIGSINQTATLCNEEIEKIYNSKGFDEEERLKMFDEFLVGEIYRGYEESITKCEALKVGIDDDIKKYNEEQQAKKQAEINRNQEQSTNSADSKKSSNNYSGQSNSGSSSSSSYSSGSSSSSSYSSESSSNSSYGSESSSNSGSSGGETSTDCESSSSSGRIGSVR